MNRIKVNLIAHSDPTAVINAMGKPYKNEKVTTELIKRICLGEKLAERHGSVLEHITLTWEVLGSSRLELQEHMRHRIASPTVESTRYVLDKMMLQYENRGWAFAPVKDYFVFPDLSNTDWSDEKKAKFDEMYAEKCRANLDSIYAFFKTFYTTKKDNDTIKYVLPENLRTNFTFTLNFRSFINFIRLRNSSAAHFEIRYIARLMLEELKQTWLWELIEDQFDEDLCPK